MWCVYRHNTEYTKFKYQVRIRARNYSFSTLCDVQKPTCKSRKTLLSLEDRHFRHLQPIGPIRHSEPRHFSSRAGKRSVSGSLASSCSGRLWEPFPSDYSWRIRLSTIYKARSRFWFPPAPSSTTSWRPPIYCDPCSSLWSWCCRWWGRACRRRLHLARASTWRWAWPGVRRSIWRSSRGESWKWRY